MKIVEKKIRNEILDPGAEIPPVLQGELRRTAEKVAHLLELRHEGDEGAKEKVVLTQNDDGSVSVTMEEVADYNHFCANRFPSFSQLKLVNEPDAPPLMAL